MVYGQQEFGNTATDNPNAACVLGHGVEAEWSYWLTPSLTAGDQLTVDFGGLANLYAYLYPVGTTDYNVSSTDWVANANAVDTQHGEVRYSAPRDGVMPLEFSAMTVMKVARAAPTTSPRPSLMSWFCRCSRIRIGVSISRRLP